MVAVQNGFASRFLQLLGGAAVELMFSVEYREVSPPEIPFHRPPL